MKALFAVSTKNSNFTRVRNDSSMLPDNRRYIYLLDAAMLIVVFLLSGLTAHATEQTALALYGKDKKSSTLLSEADKRLDGKAQPDSALMIYSIVTNRFTREAATIDEAVHAYMGKWRVYFYYYYDYSKSLESLSEALIASGKDGYKTASIFHAFGITYQTIGEQCGDSLYLKQAFDYYTRAWQLAIKLNRGELLDILMSNLINISYSTGEMKTLGNFWTEYRQCREKTPTFLFRYNQLLYEGYVNMSVGRASEALKCFEHQYQLLGKDTLYVRYHTMVFLDKAMALALMGNYSKAIEQLDNMCRLAVRCGAKDALLEGYKLKAHYYALAGKKLESDHYQMRFFELKDSIITSQQIKNIEGRNFSNKLHAAETALSKMEEHRKRQKAVAIVFACFVMLSLSFAYVLYQKNKVLKERNMALYKRITQMTRTEDHNPQSNHYKNSSLDKASKQMLLNKIKEVMENCGEIYSSDFALVRLAELVGSNYKYVSQVINETYHCNFNNYVNEYRIKEACRRINDFDRYGNMSLEGIGRSVGFKARSSFFTAFKNVTGLTPSDYARIAKENRSSNGSSKY